MLCHKSSFTRILTHSNALLTNPITNFTALKFVLQLNFSYFCSMI